MKWARPIALATVLIAGTVLNGCAMTPELTLEQAREATRSALQLMVDELPAGTTLDDSSKDSRHSCGDGRVNYITRWAAAPGEGFDGEDYIAALPSALGESFVVDDEAIPVSVPAVSLRSEGMTFDVQVLEVDGEQFVDLLGVSGCGTVPAD